MQNLIISDEQLRAIIPNIQRPAPAETTWGSRLATFLDTAAHVMESYIVRVAELTDSVRQDAERFVALYAWFLAIPSLDLVATPNGFAVISNQTLAPASAQRVEEARKNALAMADETACAMLDSLRMSPDWKTKPNARRFDSIFPDPRDFAKTFSVALPFFSYIKAQDRIKRIETDIAVSVISAKGMRLLRAVAAAVASGQVTDINEDDLHILDIVRNIVFRMSDIDYSPSKDFNMLRHELDTAENSVVADAWRQSQLYRAFKLKPYANEKNSGGYFF